jgi:hypothetical protein
LYSLVKMQILLRELSTFQKLRLVVLTILLKIWPDAWRPTVLLTTARWLSSQSLNSLLKMVSLCLRRNVQLQLKKL